MASKKIKDPLYGLVEVEEKYLKFFNSKYFQRLRHIKQTSFIDEVYPSATHSRYSHCIGVFFLMKKFVNNGYNKLSEEKKDNLILSALFHDLGHGPFSHSFEKVFKNFDHEEMTKKIIKEEFGLEKVVDILSGKDEFKFLLSSTIDVDTLDYMKRDSYFCGLNSSTDVDYLLSNCYVKNGKFIIRKKAILGVEDLLAKRINNYKTIYFHKSSVKKDFLFEKIFKRVKHLIKEKKDIQVNKNLLNFFENNYKISDLFNLCDYSILENIKIWSDYKQDEILRILSQNFLNYRDDFRSLNLKTNRVNISKLKEEISKKYDVDYFFDEKKLSIKALENELYIEFKKDDFRKIEEFSELVRFYRDQKFSVEYAFFPKEIIPKDKESLDTYFK